MSLIICIRYKSGLRVISLFQYNFRMWRGFEDDPFRKRVNLSGTSSLTRSSIVELARRERELREVNKKREISAVKIQRLWRGFKSRKVFYDNLLNSAISRISDFFKFSGIEKIPALQFCSQLIIQISLAKKFTAHEVKFEKVLEGLLRLLSETRSISYLPKHVLEKLIRILVPNPVALNILMETPSSSELLLRLAEVPDFVKACILFLQSEKGISLMVFIVNQSPHLVLKLLEYRGVIANLIDLDKTMIIKRIFSILVRSGPLVIDCQETRDNIDALIIFALQNSWEELEMFIWLNKWIIQASFLDRITDDETVLQKSLDFPGVFISFITQSQRIDLPRALSLAVARPAILKTYISFLDTTNVEQIRTDPFTAEVVSAFSAIYALTLRVLHSHEICDCSVNPLSLEDARSIALALNKMAVSLLLSERVRPRSVASNILSLVRAFYEKRKAFGLDDEAVWLVGDLGKLNFDVSDLEYALTAESYDEDSEEMDISPRSGSRTPNDTGNLARILRRIPHVISFNRRVEIFQKLLIEKRIGRDGWRDRIEAVVRREYLLQDGFAVFHKLGQNRMGLRISVTFISPEGNEESGIDGGGLFKEFLHLWFQAAVSPQIGLFTQLPNGSLCADIRSLTVTIPKAIPLPKRSELRLRSRMLGQDNSEDELIHIDQTEPLQHTQMEPQTPQQYFFAVGRSIGKSLLESILCETRFSEVFLNRVLGRASSIDELSELDPELYKNLLFVKGCKNVEDLGLTFTVTTSDGEVELIPNGSNTQVTNMNRLRYIHLLARYKTVNQIAKQARLFADGIANVIPMSYLRIFAPNELQLLLSGEERKGFDVADLKLNCHITGREDSPTIEMFWKLLESEFTDEDKMKLLTFVTSSPRAPLLGFKALNPLFTIYIIPDSSRLPTASTCVNLLKLPDYRDINLLRTKLMQAIYSQAGFDLS